MGTETVGSAAGGASGEPTGNTTSTRRARGAPQGGQHGRSAPRAGLVALPLATVALALALAACSSNTYSAPKSVPTNRSSYSATTPTTSSPRTAGGYALGTRHTSLGTILVTGKGYTLYAFSKDTPTKSNCPDGPCTSVWPPLRTSGAPKLGSGVNAAKIREIRRAGGREQVTYAGWPLYTYSPDTSPGQTLGQGLNAFGGYWYTITPAGTLVQSPTSGGYSGY